MDTDTDMSKQGENLNNDFQATLDHLSESVGQLQTDMGTLLSHTVEAGKSGVGVLRSQAHQAMDGLKHRVSDLKEAGNDHLHDIEHKIEANPLLSVIIAMGAGFILSSILHRR
jgi:ElaB/YqjD/DUF883 family membrane-anchored ribosome-binding protein